MEKLGRTPQPFGTVRALDHHFKPQHVYDVILATFTAVTIGMIYELRIKDMKEHAVDSLLALPVRLLCKIGAVYSRRTQHNKHGDRSRTR